MAHTDWEDLARRRIRTLQKTATAKKTALSQTQIARAIGWDQSGVSNYLTGSAAITINRLARWADLYGVTLAEMFAPEAPIADELQTLFSGLPSDAARQHVLGIMREFPGQAKPSGDERRSWQQMPRSRVPRRAGARAARDSSPENDDQ